MRARHLRKISARSRDHAHDLKTAEALKKIRPAARQKL
jgi:hypothetical protein